MSGDLGLQRAVLAELNFDPSLAAGRIVVTVHAGIVTLSGCVDSFAARHAADTAARRVPGALAVAEQIEVRIPSECQRADKDIAATGIDRLAWAVALPLGAITLAVENGRVTLGGRVDCLYQSQAAFHCISGLAGVVDILNQIDVTPPRTQKRSTST